MRAPPILSSVVVHDCLSHGVLKACRLGLIGIPGKVLDFQFLMPLQFGDQPLFTVQKWKRSFGKLPCPFLASCQLLIEFESLVLVVGKFVHSFYGTNCQVW